MLGRRSGGGAPRPDAPLKVLVACPGVGHVARGFETFARDCFENLRGEDDLDVMLVGGAGSRGPRVRVARTFKRDRWPARTLGRAVRRDGYFAEQMGFAASCIPLIARERPDVVYFSDWVTGGALGRWRRLTGAPFRLLLSNGAPGPPPYDWTIDHVQQLTPFYMDLAIGAGEAPARHTLLPLGVAVEPVANLPAEAERVALRERLGLPANASIVLSVAALNCWHKRLDYVIRELASLPSAPHLVMLGQPEEETRTLLKLAGEQLGEEGFTARTVAPAEVADYYRAADIFVLGSQFEGMGLVIPEALAHGLTVVAHDTHWSRFATGGHAVLADLGRDGALATAVSAWHPATAGERLARHRFVLERFGWETLRPRYLEMIRACASVPAIR